MVDIPLPIGTEDWRTWATRMVQALGNILGPTVATETGRLAEFLTNAIPPGWLPANGGNISNASYPRLAQVLGTTYGAAPAGQTKLPNFTSTHTGYTIVVKA